MSALNGQQQKLLSALRAANLIPKLYARLTLERYSASDEELRRMASWPDTLRQDPGWELLRLSLDEPRAWPSVWHQAVERGFSPTSDHHHALLFERLSARFAQDQDFEGALWAFNECVGAWRRVMSTSYLTSLIKDLIPEADEATRLAHMKSLTDLLDPLVDERVAQLKHAMRLDDVELNAQDGAKPPTQQLDRRMIRFAWSALEMTQLILNQPGQDPLGALARLSRRAQDKQTALRAEATTRFRRMIEALDLSQARDAVLVAPFDWAKQAFELIGIDLMTSVEVVEQAVELGWSLRRLGRDDDEDFKLMLRLAEPFNEHLAHHMDTPEALGHNSKCADFLVFQGELLSDRAQRRQVFERGVKLCPGHRNSLMLLSHEQLHEANLHLGQSKVRDLTGAKHAGQQLKLAWSAYKQAEQTYPHNKDLEKTRQRIEEAAKQANIKLD